MPANPFVDIYSEPVFTNIPRSCDQHAAKVLEFPDTVQVPFIQAVPPMPAWSPESSVSSLARGPSVTPQSFYASIKWTNADLQYLLSVLCPNKMFFDDFIFEPPLEELQGASSPVQLHLYVCVPYQIPPEAYSASAPIGTGRPISKAFVASSKSCSSPSEARQSLAEALLADRDAFSFVAARFTLLSTLYSLPMASIAGIKRGMAAMAQTSASELSARLKQLRDAGVNHSWEFDAQLERLLLEEMFPLKQKSLLRGGMWQLQMWIGCVEVALWLSQERREFFAEVYGEAGAFLKTALQSMPGGSWNAEGSFA